MPLTPRLATFEDIPELQQLIALSARGLSRDYYSDAETEGAIKYVFGVDSQLIADGTYFVVELKDRIIACGGWSRRNTLFGGDQHKEGNADPLLNPATDPARIRAFFVHPEWARQGLGKMLISVCEKAAHRYGFTRMEIGATLPGVPLYESMGYHKAKKINVPLPNGEQFMVVNMKKDLNL